MVSSVATMLLAQISYISYIQTAIPVIFSYFPLSMILLFGPVTGMAGIHCVGYAIILFLVLFFGMISRYLSWRIRQRTSDHNEHFPLNRRLFRPVFHQSLPNRSNSTAPSPY